MRLTLGCRNCGVVSVRMRISYGCREWRCPSCNSLLAHHDKSWKLLPRHVREGIEKRQKASLEAAIPKPAWQQKMRHAGTGVTGG